MAANRLVSIILPDIPALLSVILLSLLSGVRVFVLGVTR